VPVPWAIAPDVVESESAGVRRKAAASGAAASVKRPGYEAAAKWEAQVADAGATATTFGLRFPQAQNIFYPGNQTPPVFVVLSNILL
jgi:hypothetical protein